MNIGSVLVITKRPEGGSLMGDNSILQCLISIATLSTLKYLVIIT